MTTVQTAVELLLAGRRTGRPQPAPDLADEAAAYAVQRGVGDALGWFSGATPIAWKSGAASRTAHQTHAPLPPAGVWASPAQARDWPFRFRYIEAEIALRIGRDVDAASAATLDAASAARLVDAMCVSIEVVDSRWAEGSQAPALARLGDLLSHGALVLGEWRPFEPRDWSAQRCRVRIGDAPPVERLGTHPTGDPAWLLPAWLRHAAALGPVRTGTVLTTGSWVGLLEAQAGDLVEAEFEGVGTASVQL